jgi:hypothetical protein
MKKLTIETYIKRTPKNKVVKFLRDRVTSRVNENMTKQKIYYTLSLYDLLKTAQEQIDLIRPDWRFTELRSKYGLI